jgi:hypothetical protein
MSAMMKDDEALEIADEILSGEFDWDMGSARLKVAGLCYALKRLSAQPEATAIDLLRRIADANVIFPSMCANNMEAWNLTEELKQYRSQPQRQPEEDSPGMKAIRWADRGDGL